MPAVMTSLRRWVHPGALLARRDVRLVVGGLIVFAVIVIALRVAGVGFDRIAGWLPAVVDRERGAEASPATLPADLPADQNVVPPPEGDADAPTSGDSDTVNPGPPPAGDVSPPPEP